MDVIRILGVLCGLALLAMVTAGLYITVRPLYRERESGLHVALLLLATIAIVKFGLLLVFPGLWYDVTCFNLWSFAMARVGPSRIYDPLLLAAKYGPKYRCDYPPGYLYVLWLTGSIANAVGVSKTYNGVRLFTETPPLIADFFLGLTIFARVRRLGYKHALVGMLLFALNPGLIFDTVVWGQIDSVLAFLILLSVLLVIDSRYELGWAVGAVAVLVKPQALVLIPVLALWTLSTCGLRKSIRAAAAFIGTLVLGSLPFEIGNWWGIVPSLYFSAAERYRVTSAYAFNLIGLLGGLYKPDGVRIAGISAFALGMVLFLMVYALVVYMFLRRTRTERVLVFATFLTYLGMFVLAPRMHERYLYFAVTLLIPIVFDSVVTLVIFITLTTTFFFNIAFMKYASNYPAIGIRLLATYHWLIAVVALTNLAMLVLSACYVSFRLFTRDDMALEWFGGTRTGPPHKLTPSSSGSVARRGGSR
jgi:dolichyl-phosphate-mannose-protein mannosyltransferase